MLKTVIIMALLLVPGASSAYAQTLPRPQTVLQWNRAERLVGFKNMEKITAVHEVKNGSHVRPLQAPQPGSDLERLAKALKKPSLNFMSTGDIAGVIIIKDDVVLVEQYGAGLSPGDRWTSFSVAKSFTSTLVGAALQDGHIKNLDEQVVKYVPELKNTAYDGVSIRHLLTMTSGVAWNEDYSDPDSSISAIAMGIGDPKSDYIAALGALPKEAEPGMIFSYKTGESNLLGIVVSRAVKMSLSDYLSKKIWKPCGMEKSAFWAVDNKGMELGGCCLSMTLRDYARFGLFMMDGGHYNGKDILPSTWLKEAAGPSEKSSDYGYQWHLYGDEAFVAIGIYGQMLIVSPKYKSVIVILSAWDSPLSQQGAEQRFAYLGEVVKKATQWQHSLKVKKKK